MQHEPNDRVNSERETLELTQGNDATRGDDRQPPREEEAERRDGSSETGLSRRGETGRRDRAVGEVGEEELEVQIGGSGRSLKEQVNSTEGDKDNQGDEGSGNRAEVHANVDSSGEEGTRATVNTSQVRRNVATLDETGTGESQPEALQDRERAAGPEGSSEQATERVAGMNPSSDPAPSTGSNPPIGHTSTDSRPSPDAPLDGTVPKATDSAASSSLKPESPTPSIASSPLNSTTSTASPNPPTASLSTSTKRFSSSLSVNKKFLEKAGEKAHKPETKLTTTRLSTPPTPSNPSSTSHPRLLSGKVSTLISGPAAASSTGPTIQLSTKTKASNVSSATQAVSQTGGSSTTISWSKKPSSSGPNGSSFSTSSQTNGASGSLSSGQRSLGSNGGGAVWSTSAAKNNSGPGVTTKVGSYGGIGLGRGSGGGFNLATGDFPTAAEAAHAKEARARAVMEQMQARERALQARAAAAAAQNANLLQNLDAFRGVHLDPNAHHWDEDEDDFLDTTIEFGDGTQYKITEEDAAAAQQQEEAMRQAQTETQTKPAAKSAEESESLREPSPSELARLETPLGPGEVVEPLAKSREERFGDDYDRSWPPKRPQPPAPTIAQRPATRYQSAEKEDSNRNLFNDRLGKLEPAQHGQATSSILGRRRLSNGADRGSQDLPPHLLDRRDPTANGKSSLPPRRPSINLKHHEQAHPLPVRNAWPRRPSNDLPVPAHGGRQLPPHLAATATNQNPAPAPNRTPSITQSSAPPPEASSPTRPLAPLPESTPSDATPAPIEAVPTTAADLEELHAREMHAAAERAKKRRQEEEQARLEQIERARKKAAELEAKMMPKSAPNSEKATEAPVAPVAKQDKPATEKVKERSENPWRTAAKPPAPTPAVTAIPAPTSQPTSILGRNPSPAAATAAPPAQQPTSILARPTQEKAASTSAPAQPETSTTWRRPSNAASSPPPALKDSATAPVGAATFDKPISSPPLAASPPTMPSSPSHERKSSGKLNPLGYKAPEVSQLDDLMSRIKGAMLVKESSSRTGEENEENGEDELATVPTVKLPPPSPVAKLPRARSSDSTVPFDSRGRVRGRSEAPRNGSKAAPPSFENRDPPLPFYGTRRARSPSPPPAWKAYAVKIASRPPHKAPHYRNVTAFLSVLSPRPVHDVFLSNPLIPGINPRRLNRDDTLIPKKFVRGVPQCPVRIPTERITRRTREEETALLPAKPPPTVNIASNLLLVRASGSEARTPENPVGEDPGLDSAANSGSRGRGKGRLPDSGSWRRAREAIVLQEAEKVKSEQEVDGQTKETSVHEATKEATGSNVTSKSKLPLGSSIGFYRSPANLVADEDASERSADGAKMFMVTSELKGEKITATPREVTTAPGSDTAARSKLAPSSPPFKPKDVGAVLTSPSAAWTNKSLALSVLDPTASSVWSAAPVDSTTHARTISENQPENSLQGIVDDDPSVALPSSLAELKSEDEQSNEGKEITPSRRPVLSKDDAQLRAVAPSFSSFLHDSAAAIDISTSPSALPSVPSVPLHAPQSQHLSQALAYPSYGSSHPSIPPQSTPSPVNPYSPSATAYSQQLYGPPNQYTRGYGLSLASNVSPFIAQPASHHQQHYSPASPVTASLGYPAPVAASSPNLYPRALPSSASQSIPHGITNPALIANYNGAYGQNLLNSARYGAVGAGARPSVVSAPPTSLNPHSQQQTSFYSQHPQPQRASYPSHQQATPAAPSYHSQPSPYTANSYLPNSPYRSTDPYHSIPQVPASSYDYPPAQSPSRGIVGGRGGHSHGHGHGHSSSNTMPSPVIVPQHLPAPPPFFPPSHGTSSATNPSGGLGAPVNGYVTATRYPSARASSGGGRQW